MTREEAIALYESKWWEGKSSREIVEFQLNEPKLCMEFSDFHKAVEEVLGRPVYTHEFAFKAELLKELNGEVKREGPMWPENWKFVSL